MLNARLDVADFALSPRRPGIQVRRIVVGHLSTGFSEPSPNVPRRTEHVARVGLRPCLVGVVRPAAMEQVANAVPEDAGEEQRAERVLLHVTGYVFARLGCLIKCVLRQCLASAASADCLSALQLYSLR